MYIYNTISFERGPPGERVYIYIYMGVCVFTKRRPMSFQAQDAWQSCKPCTAVCHSSPSWTLGYAGMKWLRFQKLPRLKSHLTAAVIHSVGEFMSICSFTSNFPVPGLDSKSSLKICSRGRTIGSPPVSSSHKRMSMSFCLAMHNIASSGNPKKTAFWAMWSA